MPFNAFTAKRHWDASANRPFLVPNRGENGDAYIVTVAGATDLGQGDDWQVNDIVYFAVDRWVRLNTSNTNTYVGFDTLSSLRAYRGTSRNAFVAYRATVGDGGGGQFYVKPGDTTTADDGNMVVVDALGRRWWRVWNGSVFAGWFGAKGDARSCNSQDVSITSGNKTLAVVGAQFTHAALDVGKLIVVSGAGAAGGLLSTTITAINSTTSVQLQSAASTTLANVASYISVGTDDTVALQTAFNFLSSTSIGGNLELDARAYCISAAIGPSNNANVYLRGQGQSSSIIVQTNLTANGLVFSRSNFRGGGYVKDVTIESGPGRQLSDWFGPGSSGTAILADGMSDNFAVTNVQIANFGYGVKALGCWNIRLSELLILFYASVGLYIDKSTTTSVGGGTFLEGTKISNNGYTGNIPNSVGIQVRSSGGEFFDTVDVQGGGACVLINPPIGEQVAYITGNLLIADSATGDGVVIDTSGGRVGAFSFKHQWCGFNGGNGFVVKGNASRAPNIQLGSVRIRENGKNGVQLETPNNFLILDGSINNNSRGAPNTYDGVHVEAGASNWHIRDCFIGNDSSSAESSQRNGIGIEAGATDNFSVMGCVFAGNVNAEMVNGATGTAYRLESNMPRTVTGINVTNGWFPGTISAGRNAAIVHSLKQGNDSALSIYSDAAGQIVFDPNQASNPGTKYDSYWQKYGGAFYVGGFIGMSASYFPGVGTTASAANAYLNSGSSPGNQLLRSTSSLAYKDEVEPMWEEVADRVVMGLKPIWYRSKAPADRKDHSWYGVSAEDLAELEPRLVHYGYQERHYDKIVEPEHWLDFERPDGRKERRWVPEFVRYELKPGAQMVPDGVMYDRLVVMSIDVLRRLVHRVDGIDQRLSKVET